MTCCIVGLLLLTVVGRLRRIFGGRAGEPALFAPVARRPAAGQDPAAVAALNSEPAARMRPATANVLRYCTFGIIVCLVGVPVLVWTGALHNTGSATGWLLRCACYLAAVIAAAALSRSGTIWRAPAGVGTLLIVVGAVIFELSVIDMHIFGVIDIDPRDMLAYALFHNIGPVLAMVGGLLLYGSMGRTATSDRSPRSTVTIAQPSSSAVTVSSTPPITT